MMQAFQSDEHPYAVRVSGLRKTFGSLLAVDDLRLEVRRGEIFGLVGPDGAGKTTAMRLLTGILDADSGEGEIAGYDLFRQPEMMKRHIGYMPQRFSVYGDLTVAENLYFFANLYHVPRSKRIAREQELLAFSRLEPFRRRLAANLSGGMKQKLALACVLMHTPDVLFLDEPTTGVDPVSRRDFWHILYSLQQDGATIVVSTPYMDEAERCHRVALIDKGHIMMCDTPSALKERMQGELLEIIARPQRPAKELISQLDGVLGVQVFGDRLHVWVTATDVIEPTLREALRRQEIVVEHFQRVSPGLEDVFLSLIRGELS